MSTAINRTQLLKPVQDCQHEWTVEALIQSTTRCSQLKATRQIETTLSTIHTTQTAPHQALHNVTERTNYDLSSLNFLYTTTGIHKNH